MTTSTTGVLKSPRPRCVRRHWRATRPHPAAHQAASRVEAARPAHAHGHRGFLRAMSTEPGRHGKPLSPRSVQYLHAILRNVLRHAMREELLVRNVARLVQVPAGQPREVTAADTAGGQRTAQCSAGASPLRGLRNDARGRAAKGGSARAALVRRRPGREERCGSGRPCSG